MEQQKQEAEIQVVHKKLAFWQAYEPAVKCDLSSCAILTREGLVLVDPISLTENGMAALQSLGRPHAIVLTNGNHLRDAMAFRSRLEIPIFASANAATEAGILVDRILTADELVAGFRVVSIEGAGPGEIALYGEGTLCIGDSIINLSSHEFSLLPEKYCDAPEKLRDSLRKLLQYEFQVMTFAHGAPLIKDAHSRLENLLI